jgi:hypothetical protein
MTESRCSGEKWLERAGLLMDFCPASFFITMIDALAIASLEQDMWRLQCET